VAAVSASVLALLWPAAAGVHGVARGDARFLQSLQGAAVAPLMYLGAQHMVTGYDHLLFLIGVIFLSTFRSGEAQRRRRSGPA